MAPTDARELHAREHEYWNGDAGRRWTSNQARVDAVLAPVAALGLDRAQITKGLRVVDIGCGCGVTSIELGRRVGGDGAVLGLDISAPMLERARQRCPADLRVEFVLDDAATHSFARDAYDLLFSRFGVMFFGDPAAAFTNMRSALRPGGRLLFVCWRTPAENPWMMVPLQATYEHVPPLPKPEPEDPGPFSFASEERVRRILSQAGFSEIALAPSDLRLDLAAGCGLDAAVSFAVEIGATNRAIEGHDEAVVDAVEKSVRRSLEPWADGSSVELPAAIWLVSAVNA